MKECNKCKKRKLLSEFLKSPTNRDGHWGKCKLCKNRRSRELYKENREKTLARVREYAKTEAGRKNKREMSMKMHRKYPERTKARKKLGYSVTVGKIAKLACEACGNFLSEAHHPDYNKPLEVWWLCKKHHRQADIGELVLYV